VTSRVAVVLVLGVALVVGLAVVAAVMVLLPRPETPSRVSSPPVASLAPDAHTPEDFARAACVRLRLGAQGIRADSSAETVRTELAAARALAAEAVRGDGRYAGLSGGVAALDEAVRRDQPDSAGVGLRIALAECDIAFR